jgi:hypothetical protein
LLRSGSKDTLGITVEELNYPKLPRFVYLRGQHVKRA